MFQNIKQQAEAALKELLETAKLSKGDIFVVGCSSSEVAGRRIGTDGSTEIAEAIFEGIYPILHKKGIYLAAQCCEHLNRALIIEREAAKAYGYEIVNAVPIPHAGGSFAAFAYKNLTDPVAVEGIIARAGIDIGGTLIGMHLAPVAVPVRLSVTKIGEANIICARSRAKYIGGSRANYDDLLS